MNRNTLLAFDQALNTTGWSLFNEDQLTEYDKFTTSSFEVGDKLLEIKNHIVDLLQTKNPSKVCIEEIQLQKIPGASEFTNVETFKKLAYVQAVFILVLVENKIPYEVIPSSSWKSTCGVKGRARADQKKNAQNFVLEFYGVKAIQDICDSVCIGHHSLKEKDKEINWG